MIIVADEYIRDLEMLLIGHKLLRLPAAAITRDVLQHADVLLVRSVTQVDEKLLAGSSVRFVGTMTSGTDHLDTLWLAKAGIHWASAKGANAPTVVEYVLCCISALRARQQLPWHGGRAGIIGAGMVGSSVASLLSHLGFTIIIHDPVRAEREPGFIFTPLSRFIDLDLICVHAELTHTAAFPSYHLLDEQFLNEQRRGCVLINAARGGIIATEALLTNSHCCLCLDVWEHEPFINLQLLQQATIASPHIAGYSLQAKQRAVRMVIHQLQQVLHCAEDNVYVEFAVNVVEQKLATWKDIDDLQQRALQCLDLFACTQHMRQQLLAIPVSQLGAKFEALRQLFVARQEFL